MTLAERRALRQQEIHLDIEMTRLGIALALGVPVSAVWNTQSGGGFTN